MIPHALSLVAFDMVDRPAKTLFAELTGEPVVPDIPGGWVSVDRPKRRDMTDWKGQGLKQLTIPCRFNKWMTQESVEDDITSLYRLIEGWGLDQAPIVRLTGLVPLTHLLWTVNGISWGDYLRREGDGARVRQNFVVTMLEYVSPDFVVNTQQSQAQVAAGNATGGSTKTYTVRSGDTLSGIAASQLGDYRRWPEIASLNGIRDPKSLKVGQVLRLP